MSELYDRLQAAATRLVERFDQEGAEVVVRVVTPPVDPLLPPTVVETGEAIPAVARGVSADITASDPNLVGTDIQVIMDQRGGVLAVGGNVTLDGVPRIVVRIDRIPAMGQLCAVRAYVR